MGDKRKSVTVQEEKSLLNPSINGTQNNLNINKTTEEVTEEQLVNYNAEWSDEHEMILVEWADKAMCFRWLHSKARIKYYIKNIWFTIPVIIISTLTGTANFAIERIPEEYQPYYTITVGTFNIIAGIITTIAQFLKIGELNEAHRVSSITWDKFYRNIKIELSKRRKERIPAFQMLKISKEEYDRLMETSPPIGDEIIKQFKETFSGGHINEKKGPNKKQQNYLDIIKPEICDIMETTKNFLYKQSEEEKKHAEELIKYQGLRGGNVMFDIIEKPNNFIKNELINEKSDIQMAFEYALTLEQEVYKNLLYLHKLAD